METKEKYLIERQFSGLVGYSEDEFRGMIESMYPGADAVSKRGAIVLGQRYQLDPLLKEVMIIKYRQQDKEGKWSDVYSPYIGRRGMERIANRSGIKWSISMGIPKRGINPYTGEEDIYLEAELFRSGGYPPMKWGLWLSEVALLDGKGNLLAAWKGKTGLMHQKAVEKHLLERAFSVAVPNLPDNVLVDDEITEAMNGEAEQPGQQLTAREAINWIRRRAVEYHQEGLQKDFPTDTQISWIDAHLAPLIADSWNEFVHITCQEMGLNQAFAEALIEGMRDGPLTAEVIDSILIEVAAPSIDIAGPIAGASNDDTEHQKPADGRPWNAFTLREMLHKKTNNYTGQSEKWLGPPPEGLRGHITGALNEMLGDDKRRHTFLKLIWGNDSMKMLTHAQVRATADWLDKDLDLAREEANRAVNAEINRDSVGELFDLAQDRRG